MRQKYHWHYLQKDTICSAEDFYQVVLKNRNWDLETYKAVFSWDKITPSSLGIDESQLQKAMTRLEKARDSGEQVLIFGDYDVDGNCATAIMWQGLQVFGIHATPFIPNRFTHGYGMSIKALQEIIATQKPDLIITVDNGITAHPALEFCHQQQIDVIVSDHHQPENDKTLPVAAVVHTQKLCGAGVAWYLIYRLLAQTQDLEQAQKVSAENLDLVALATIVDQVPLTNINRTLVKKGITQLQKSCRPGIIALCQAAKLQQEKINTRDIGFSLGPRINAIGRLTNTLDALRLLCTRKLGFARKLATTLSDVNRSRQELTSDMLELAQASIDPENLDKITIVASDSFHEGIIGLIASKLVDTYHRPAIVIAQSDQLAKGSARSIPGFNITNFIRHFRQQLIDAGGHEQAAGLSIASEKLNDVIAAMRHYANETITDEQLVATLTLEAPVSPDILHHPLLPSLLVDLEPYGPDNPELMMSVQAPVINVTTMGKQKEHLKVTLVDRTHHYLDILVWQYEQVGLPLPAIGQELLVAGQLQFNLWQGRNRPQILARDWRIC